jgi:hypothetical protein
MRDDEAGSTPTLPATRIPEGEPPETYADLGRDYPVALVAGGLAAGLLAGMLLPRGTGRKLIKGAAAMAIAAGEVGKTYGQQALDAAGEGREKLKDLGHEAGDLGKKLSDAAGPAAVAGKDLGMRLIRLAIGLLERM